MKLFVFKEPLATYCVLAPGADEARRKVDNAPSEIVPYEVADDEYVLCSSLYENQFFETDIVNTNSHKVEKVDLKINPNADEFEFEGKRYKLQGEITLNDLYDEYLECPDYPPPVFIQSINKCIKVSEWKEGSFAIPLKWRELSSDEVVKNHFYPHMADEVKTS